jgi:putative addiction module component (TIGR02574 family)
MTKVQVRTEALKLPVQERLELAQSLWDSVEEDVESLPLHPWQKEILDRRLADAEQNPDSWLAWDEVKARVLSALKNPSEA